MEYVISGATSPLGLALTTELIKKGKRCTLLARDETSLVEMYPDIASEGRIWSADFANKRDVDRISDRIHGSKPAVWAYIHLAATSVADDFEVDKLCEIFTVNAFSAWQIARVCVDKMKQHNGGRIVFVGSVGHKFGGKTDRAAYSGSKYLLEFFPQYFRDCARHNVLVNCVRAGVMRGGTNNNAGISRQRFSDRVAKMPTRKPVSHREVSDLIMRLCSKNNQSIHNAVIPCSGGE